MDTPENAARPRWSMVLRALREARGVTLDGWGARLGVSRTTVQRWERGDRAPDPGAEASILAFCREAGLFRTYDRGPLAGLNLTAEMLQDLLAEARWRVSGRPPDTAPPDDRTDTSPADSPPQPHPRPPHANLPVQLSSFVGRQREIAAVRRVQAGTRLLSLTGTGGCGKTRLALALAEELLWAYPNGVWFVDLAPLSDPALVPQVVASALAIHTTEPQPVTEALIDALRQRHLLLLLDNCEHLLSTCADLAETLLRACPHLSVVTTSRSPLGIAGETIWRVPPMSVPGSKFQVPQRGPHLEPGTQNPKPEQPDSVRLFAERARLQRPDFLPTPAEAAAVAEICRRLDGMPLAIELAAARVNVLSVGQIAERLHDRFSLLTSGVRAALPRHQTLRAAIDWSHDLLTEPERAVFRALSVFAGGFTLEAAEAVCEAVDSGQSAVGDAGSGPSTAHWPLPAASVLDLLARLVDQSLVHAEEHDGAVRYRMLETVRQYAAEHLTAAGEARALRDRHLAWCLTLAESAQSEMQGPHEVECLARLEREHDNLRVALAWSLTQGKEEAALRLAGALPRFWELRGHMSEGRQWLARVLESGAGAASAPRAMALNGAAILAQMQGDYAAARTFAQESLCINHQAGSKQGIAEARWSLGYVALRCGDHDEARASLEESLTLHTDLGCTRGIAGAHGALGVLTLRQGNHDTARGHFEASLALHREIGDKDGVAAALVDLASVTGAGNIDESPVALLEESLALYQEIGNRQGIALVLGNLGMTVWFRGDHELAATLLAESLTLYREVGDRRGIARLLGDQAFMALSQRDYPRAAARSCESLTLYRVVHDPWAIARYLPVLAGAALGQGQTERAARLFAAAAAMRGRLGASLPSVVQRSHDRAVAAVRATLGETAFAAAWAAGQTLTPDEALQDATLLSTNGGDRATVSAAAMPVEVPALLKRQARRG